MIQKVQTKGTKDEGWQEHSIEIPEQNPGDEQTEKQHIQSYVDSIFGIIRDDQGNQTNADMIQVKLIK